MAYIGNRPANQALTANDIADGIVTNDKLAIINYCLLQTQL
jgi:hypothetical protein